MDNKHNHDWEEKHPQPIKRVELVLNEKNLQQFFSSDVSHLDRRRYRFSTEQRALTCGKMVLGKDVFEKLQQDSERKGSLMALIKSCVINETKHISAAGLFAAATNLEHIKTQVIFNDQHHAIEIYCYVSAFSNCPVETEAMAGATAGLLAIYDQYKHMNPALRLGDVQLLFREDGHEGLWFSPEGIPDTIKSIFTPPEQYMKGIKAVVLSISDKALKGTIADAGTLLKVRLEEQGAEVIDYKLLPSDQEAIIQCVKQIVAEKNPQLIMLRGAIGISPYDQTPFAMEALCQRLIPGLAEMLRIYGSLYTSGSWNACCQAGILDKTLIISLPGARKAIDEIMKVLPITLADAVDHINEKTLTGDHACAVDIPWRIWS